MPTYSIDVDAINNEDANDEGNAAAHESDVVDLGDPGNLPEAGGNPSYSRKSPSGGEGRDHGSDGNDSEEVDLADPKTPHCANWQMLGDEDAEQNKEAEGAWEDKDDAGSRPASTSPHDSATPHDSGTPHGSATPRDSPARPASRISARADSRASARADSRQSARADSSASGRGDSRASARADSRASGRGGSRGGSRQSRTASREGKWQRDGGGTPLSEEQQQQLMRRLWKSDELIKQLKHIVKAQHVKIEELRDKLEQAEQPVSTVQNMMAQMDVKDIHLIKKDGEELRAKMNTLKADVLKYKAENDTLKKVNRRLKAMLGHSGFPVELSQVSSASARSETLPRLDDKPPPQSALDLHASNSAPKAIGIMPIFTTSENVLNRSIESVGSLERTLSPKSLRETVLSGTAGSTSLVDSATDSFDQLPPSSPLGEKATVSTLDKLSVSSPKKTGKKLNFSGDLGLGAHAPALPSFSKLSLLHNVLPMFWRHRLDTPLAVVRAVNDIATRLVSERHGTSATLYLLDAWLRQSAAAAAGASAPPPTLFYLAQGKTQLQVLHQEGVRPEPPRFPDLTSLPTRTRRALAVGLLLPTTRRCVAVLQVCISDVVQRKASPKESPKILRHAFGEEVEKTPTEPQGFSDSQLISLQMVCNVAGGLLEQLERLNEKETVLERMRGCVDVAVVINKARSLPDFEQRVKHLLSTFFSVNIVRVLYYNNETQKLLVPPAQMAQMRRKECVQIPLEKGIVGLCARRMQVIHIANLSQHPYVDATADGLERNGKPVSPQAEMLCGPMIVDYDAGGHLVGIIQLLERSKASKKGAPGIAARAGGKDVGSKEFSNEDQKLFDQILRVCAHCAWRVRKVQELSAKAEGAPSGLDRMVMS